MRAVADYDSKYFNAAGYWSAFHETAIALRQEYFVADNDAEAQKYYVWAIIAVRYELRVLGLRTEFYKMASKDPVYAKMFLPSFERLGKFVAADDPYGPMRDLSSHMAK